MSEPTISLGTREDGSPHELPVSAFDCHAQFIGPTRYGKTRAMANVTQQLIDKRPDAAFVVIDPKGDLYDLMKGWAYEQGLGDRLILLDVRDREHVLGFNPLKPHWSLEPEEQANHQFNILGRVLKFAEQQTAVLTQQRDKWIRNALVALIRAELTLIDAAPLLDPANGAQQRAGVLPHLPPSETLHDFEALQLAQGNPTALRTMHDQVGHAVNQFRRLTASSVLQRMYASDRTIDFHRLFDDRRILLVRLAPDKNVIDPQHQQLLGMQLVNEVIREVMGRSPADRVPAYCVIDEAGRFVTDDVTEVLDQGGSYRLSLFLAHQHCSQFVRPENDGGRKFLDSVLTNAHVKFVSGGLQPLDAKEISDTLIRHHLDPDKKQLVETKKRQLQEVVPVISVTEGTQKALALSEGDQWAHARGHVASETSDSRSGRHRMAGQNAGDITGVITTVDPVTGVPTVTTTFVRVAGSSDAAGDDESGGRGQGESDIDMDTEGGFTAKTKIAGKSKAITAGLAVHPTEPFDEETHQIEPLDTQQHRFTSKMIAQPKQHEVSAIRKEEPVFFRVVEVPDPELTAGQIQYLDTQVARRNRELYSSPAEIDAMIAARRERLLAPAVVIYEQPPALPSHDAGERIVASDSTATRRASRRAEKSPPNNRKKN